MKKLLIASNIVMAALLLFAFKSSNEKKITAQNTPPNSQNIKLGVDADLAKDIVVNYRSNIWYGRKINSKNYLDARSVWFSLYKLKKFIADIEQKVGTTGKNNQCLYDSLDLGVRIYFGNYPSTQPAWDAVKYDNYFTDHKLPKTYMGLHTVMMVPTVWNPADSFYYDFDPRYVSLSATNTVCRITPLPINEVMIKIKNAAATIEAGQVLAGNDFYSIMPDNLDNKKFVGKPMIAGRLKGPGQLGTTSNNEVDFTNGGTLIPPPYPEDLGGARMSSNKYQVPCSGASFMRYADGNPAACGWYDNSNTNKQK